VIRSNLFKTLVCLVSSSALMGCTQFGLKNRGISNISAIAPSAVVENTPEAVPRVNCADLVSEASRSLRRAERSGHMAAVAQGGTAYAGQLNMETCQELRHSLELAQNCYQFEQTDPAQDFEFTRISDRLELRCPNADRTLPTTEA